MELEEPTESSAYVSDYADEERPILCLGNFSTALLHQMLKCLSARRFEILGRGLRLRQHHIRKLLLSFYGKAEVVEQLGSHFEIVVPFATPASVAIRRELYICRICGG